MKPGKRESPLKLLHLKKAGMVVPAEVIHGNHPFRPLLDQGGDGGEVYMDCSNAV